MKLIDTKNVSAIVTEANGDISLYAHAGGNVVCITMTPARWREVFKDMFNPNT